MAMQGVLNMRRLMAAILASALALVPVFAVAQSTAAPVVTGYLSTTGCPAGQTACFVQFGGSSGGGQPVSVLPTTGTPIATTITCGTTSTTLLAASAASHDVLIQNPSAAVSKVWISFTAAAAVAGTPDYELDPGAGINLPLGGDLWNGATLTCIALSSQAVSVTYR